MLVSTSLCPRQRRIFALVPLLYAISVPVLAWSHSRDSTRGGAPVIGVDQPTPLIPPPLLLRPVSKDDAIAINRSIPFSTEPRYAAQPFVFRGDPTARTRALECLTSAVYYEAAGEPEQGQQAVAQVVLNRVRHPAFPGTICGVVYQGSTLPTGCQFSFTCDGSLLREPDRRAWNRAQGIALAALSGFVCTEVGLSTHYHTDRVVPYWATSLDKDAQVGAHIFYRWPHAWGMPAAFQRAYMGAEPDSADLRLAALINNGHWLKGSVDSDDSVELTVDPRLELLAVVQMLASGSDLASEDRRYENDAKSFFGAEAKHPAVALFAKLSKDKPDFAATAAKLLLGYSPPPDLAPAVDGAASEKDMADFIEALRYFAISSEFQRFFDGHKPFYGRVLSRTRNQVARARAYWQAYTGMSLGPHKLILSSLAMDSTATPSDDDQTGAVDPILSLGRVAADGDADILLRIEGRGLLASRGSSKTDASANAPIDQQIVRAVFARVAELSQGPGRVREHPATEAGRENAIAPRWDRQLREFETHRAEFASFSAFLARSQPGKGQRGLHST